MRDIKGKPCSSRSHRQGTSSTLTLIAVHAFDKRGLYNFQSTFGGTHVIPPRIIAGRIRYFS